MEGHEFIALLNRNCGFIDAMFIFSTFEAANRAVLSMPGCIELSGNSTHIQGSNCDHDCLSC